MKKPPGVAARKRGRKRRLNKTDTNGRRIKGAEPGRLTPQGKTAGAGHYEAVQKARMADRREKAWDLFLAGATMQQIGRQLGCSNATACTDVWAVADAKKAQLGQSVERWRAAMLARMEKLHLTHWQTRGEKPSADIIIDVLQEEAKLLGAYAQPTPPLLPGAPVDLSVNFYIPENARQQPVPAIDVKAIGSNGDGPEAQVVLPGNRRNGDGES